MDLVGVDGVGALVGGGRYRLKRFLGSGAMGRVYAARDETLDRDVALKMLHGREADELLHLKQEFRALADLHHPNLVALYDLVVEPEGQFFTMELLQGVDFVTHVRGPDAAAVGVPTAEGIARLRLALPPLIDGLEALHGAGRLHHDIKPSNILVSDDGRVVLIDFGLATLPALVPARADVSLGGTLAYMAPEVLQMGVPTVASDCYSLGVTIMQALTGAPPGPGTLTRASGKAALGKLLGTVPTDLGSLLSVLLHEDPTQRPDHAAIRALLKVPIRATAPSLLPSTASLWQAPFVDRVESLAALQAAAREVAGGSAVLLRVEGPSGIGKSALVRHFLTRMVEAGALVLASRCYPHESVPFKALDGIVDGLSDALALVGQDAIASLAPDGLAALLRLFPVLGRVPALVRASTGVTPTEPEETRRLAFLTLRDVLRALAAVRPTILWIDDLQWGDADSAVFLRMLARPREAPPLLVLLSYRAAQWEASDVATALTADDGGAIGRTLVLEPLPPEEAHTLVSTLLPDAGAQAAAIAEEAGGNPFLVCEIARYCAATRRSAAPDRHGRLPVSVQEIVQHRLATLDDDARTLLGVVAVAGGPCRRAVAQRAARLERGVGELVTMLRNECLLRHSTTGADTLLETFHDRIREAVVDLLGSETRRAHHRGLAAALEREPDIDPIVLVQHYHGCGDDERAARTAVVAAERAYAALAFEQAARLYEFALTIESPDTERWRLLRGRADALAQAGRGAVAGIAYRDAARLLAESDPHNPLVDELTRLAAEQMLRSGNIEEGTAALRTVLRSVGERYPATPRRAVLDLLHHRGRLMLRGLSYRRRPEGDVDPAVLRRLDALWGAAVGLVWADSIRSAAFHGRHTRLALDAGEPTRVVRALCTEAAFHSAIAGRWARRRAAQALAAAEALSEQLAAPLAIGLTAVCAGGSAYFAGHFPEAYAHSVRAEEILRSRCTGVAWELTNAHIFATWSLAHMGDLPRVHVLMPDLLQRARERGDLLAYCCLLGGLPNTMHLLATGALQEARAAVREAVTMWPTHDFQLAKYFGLVSATLADLYAGEPVRAWRRIQGAAPTVAAVRLLDFRLVRVEFRQLLARCALAAFAADATLTPRERRAMARLVTRTIRQVRREDMPWAAPLAEALHASNAAARGERSATVTSLIRAANGFDAAAMDLWAAAARHQAGEAAGTEAMRARGCVDPDRYAEMLIPVRSLRPGGESPPGL